VNKKMIIIVAGAGLISFGGMFAFGWLTKKAPPAPQADAETKQDTDTNLPELKLTQPQVASSGTALEDKMKVALTEKQLKELIYEVREKIKQYDHKLQELSAREQNLQTAQETLKKDIKELDDLRIELAGTISGIKTEQDKLQKSKIEIAGIEKANLVSIAATYDKMDAAQAGKILTNMNQIRGGSGEDAVKILHYMSERTKAKVLAVIAETEPAVSADFCRRLKQITQKD